MTEPLTINGKLCGDLLVNSETFSYYLNSFSSEQLDPSNTLWQNSFTAARGEGDYRQYMLLDYNDESEIPFDTMIRQGTEKGYGLCHALYGANGIADLADQDGSVCC